VLCRPFPRRQFATVLEEPATINKKQTETPLEPPSLHVPVLLKEVVEALKEVGADSSSPVAYFVDGTAGTGGHALAILSALPDSRILCIDRDKSALEVCKKRLESFGERVAFFVGSFSELQTALSSVSFPPLVSGILVDLGVGSHQLDAVDRGFSFGSDAPLDMVFAGASLEA